MSFCVKKVINFPQGGLESITQGDTVSFDCKDSQLLGGIFQDNRYVWQSKGPVLEVRNTKTGSKVSAWIFGGVLKDSSTNIICVEEIRRPNGRISLLAVGIDCTISGGIICIFDIFSSKVLRAIQIKEKISSLHIIDPGIEDLNLPGPLRNFDGILAAGTEGGDVLLIDICRQICEESLHSLSKRDELNPSQLFLLTSKHIPKIEHYKERSVRDGVHLAIHLNAVFNSATEHFVLKGPKGDDRIHVNREEVATSALYYCSQLTSLLVGYNFGAFQLWNLTTLELVYTSPVCDEHLPITHFALQEPTDDPRAFCYIWVSYSNTVSHQTGLSFAAMYSLCYESKEYQEGYGYLYQDFHYCSIRFQVELGQLEAHRNGLLPKGGYCLGFQPITKLSTNKESFNHSSVGDTLALCLVSWVVWYSKSDTQTCCILFDLNQWYKAQMPNFTNWKDCTNYLLTVGISDSIYLNGHKTATISSILLENKSLSQFIGVQRLEEHFYPTSLNFNLWILRESDIIFMVNQGIQKSLLTQLESVGPLCLVRPSDACKQALNVGLIPLFIDIHSSGNLSTEMQREIILNVALEHQLIGWLCKCASEWANGSFSSAGCSLDFILTWAFQRAIVLRTNCDKYCTSLFDYSQLRLDTNTSILLNNCTRQISGLCVLYKHIVNKLCSFVGCLDVVKEQWTALEMVSTYFEVLQWLVNVGLLPECHPSTYPRPDNSERISAPYPVQELKEFYNEKRAEMRLLCKESFENDDSLLFIDNLIERKCGGSRLQKLWQEDDGDGLYPPPSLQSLIRTYLVDGAGICHRHSLVIYLFLDLAMALDQSRYSSVVTHLIKFPAVFKVSPSIIKITQAFWQLDHGDFTTAMEQLLDPFVLGEDLQSWHHTLVMRSLLIHKHPNFALLYMKIRKPPITDEKDVLTAISLFIANNMIDEAFYFKKQYQNNDEKKLLSHLFHECSKSDSLHLVLYKCLNTDEEKAFFKYLRSVENPTCDDLQIFYYLLRSRFIEAFDTHSNIRRKFPERQGLIGQSMATKTDQIVKIFQSLLPDVNRKLVDYIRKERTNIWKEVERPTPMSVFVHDTTEQVKYKSTLIHAALTKAKRTFNESINQSQYTDLVTEETPFLRTPTICKNGKRIFTPVITPKIIDSKDKEDVYTPPSKRMRLSPRTSTTSPPSKSKKSGHALTLTPIVKRKISFLHDQSITGTNVCTPQSILKVRHLVQQRDSITDEIFPGEEAENQYRNISLQRTSLGLQPRSSLSRTSKRQHVQFDAATRFSTSVSDQSSRLLDNTPLEDILRKSSISSKDVSSILSTSDNEEPSDEVFYSPENSANLTDENIEEKKSEDKVNEKLNDQHIEEKNNIEKKSEVVIDECTEVKEKEIPAEENKVTKVAVGSPRARKSYKRSLGEMSPTRSSPRLSKLSSQNQSVLSDISEKPSTTSSSMSTDSLSPKPTRIVSKVKGRKSLSRQVLENNAFSQIRGQTPKESVISKEVSISQSEKIVVTEKSSEESRVTTVESHLNIVDTLENSEKTPDIKKSHTSSSFVSKTQCLEKTFDTDTSIDTDVSYKYDEQESSSMKLSDSLQEYIDFLMASGKKNREKEQKNELSKVQLDFAREEEKDKEEAVDYEEVLSDAESEDDKAVEVHELSSEIEELAGDKEEIVDVDVNEHIDTNEKYVKGSPNEIIIKDQFLTELTPVPMQELPPNLEGGDTSSKHFSLVIEDSSSNDEENYINEFDKWENNIFGVTDDETTFQKSKRSSMLSGTPNESYCLPDAEMAFLEDPLEPIVTKSDSVILISSSDDEGSSKHSITSNHSAYSKTTEEYIERTDSTDASNSTKEFEEENAEVQFQYEEQSERGDSESDNNSDNNRCIGEEDKRTENELIQDKIVLELKEEDRHHEIHMKKALEDRFIANQYLEDNSAPDKKNENNTTKSDSITLSDNNISNKKESPKAKEFEDENKEAEEVNPLEFIAKIDDQLFEKMEVRNVPITNKQENSIQQTNKVDQSTNTTIKIKEKRTKHLKQQEKLDSSTNTGVVKKSKNHDIIKYKYNEINATMKDNSTESQKEQDTEKEVEHVENVGRPLTRRYSLSRKEKGEQTTSSSDTTEGETSKNETVVVQVHTSNTKSEKISAKRTRRKSSTPVSVYSGLDTQNVVSKAEPNEKSVVTVEGDDDLFSNDIKTDSNLEQKSPVLARRTRRALSTSDVPRTTNLDNVSIDCDFTSSPKIIDDAAMVKLTLRKKRSASTDTVKTFSRLRTMKRNKSTDEVEDNVVERKAKSEIQMPVIPEETTEKAKAGNKAASVIDNYATARRLTRRQANLIKDVTISADTESLDEISKKRIDLEPIDPINLLDKEIFEGKSDPDENRVYEPSSPSASTATSVQKTRRSRSNSVISDVSVSPSTPKRSGRGTRSQTKSPAASGVSTRSRKHSESGSIASENSESSPSKKTRKGKMDADNDSVAKSTRSRTASVSSLKSEGSTSRKIARPRRLVSTKSDLPEIIEEKVSENVDSALTPRKKNKPDEKRRVKSKT
ncbi:protein ELYS [Diorhabda sublineata]|uniref:protein ELYS n=1 Tax=Diorhabda sublineata TaxID=1163346 RepID=UPI0024E11E04|nr:protein ELYS [Diorhabda sublineata]